MNIRDYSTSCFYALCVVIAAMIFIPNVSCFPYSYEIPDNFMTEGKTFIYFTLKLIFSFLYIFSIIYSTTYYTDT